MSVNNTEPLRFDEQFAQTDPIAVLSLNVTQLLAMNPLLVFHDSWDDLDYLQYCMLDVFPGSQVALVCHERSPVPGVDICINPAESNPSRLLVSALCHLNLTTHNLSWIHPDYLLKLQSEWGFQAQTVFQAVG
jgi:hypothetical protein